MQTEKKADKQSNQLSNRPFCESKRSSADQNSLHITEHPIVSQLMLSTCRRFRKIAKSDY